MRKRKLQRPVRRNVARSIAVEALEPRQMLSGLDGLHVPWVAAESAGGRGDEPASVSPQNASMAPSYAARLGLDAVRRDFGVTGAGQTVVVIDTGVAYDHEAFGGGYGESFTVVGGWDMAEGDADPYDDAPAGFHGTHVAGIIASRDAQRPGIAPGVDLVAIRVFDDLGRSNLSWVEDALQWVEQNRNAFRYPITTVNMSLGTAWNGRSFPGGGQLEDELARLRESGVLVVAAAGNAFQADRKMGLAYPAASPHVLPVGSIGLDGNLSDFSQRDPRMIAAPGESIESAVPDALLGRDGKADDWLRLSGTSMAAPIVSGAAALLGEAYSIFYGIAPSPDQVIDAIRSSGGRISDAATATTYATLRIDRALAAILPADDAGDGPADAGDLGAIGEAGVWRGATERIGDVDALRVRFEASGRFSFRADVMAGAVSPAVRLLDADGNLVSTGIELRVESGREYVLEVVGEEGIGRYELAWEFAADQEAAPLVWRDGRALVISDGGGAVDLRVSLGTTIDVTIDGAVSSWRAADLDRVEIAMTGEDDRVELIGTPESEELRVADGGWTWSGSEVTVVADGVADSVFRSGGGRADIALLWGSEGADVLTASPARVVLESQGRSFTAIGMDRVYVTAGGAGDDTARLAGSPGNDTLMVRPEVVRLTGKGYQIHVSGFDRTVATAGTGGTDVAWFYGVGPDDTVERTSNTAEWRREGASRRAEGFDRVSVFRRRGAARRAAPVVRNAPPASNRNPRVVYGPVLPAAPTSVSRPAPVPAPVVYGPLLPDGLSFQIPAQRRAADWSEAVDALFEQEGRRTLREPHDTVWLQPFAGSARGGLPANSGGASGNSSSDGASDSEWLDAALEFSSDPLHVLDRDRLNRHMSDLPGASD